MNSAHLLWLMCAAGGLAHVCVHAQTKYDNRLLAETALIEGIWGNDEEFVTHSRGRVPPYATLDNTTGASGPVIVEASVLVEKIKIDTVEQIATIRWWLRQSWKDPRLAWNTADFSYGKGQQSGVISSISRKAGPEGGTWTPDLTLWESHFDGTQSNAVFIEPQPLTIRSDGSVFWSVPQQVRTNIKPRMDMRNFPFDKQNVTFTLGPWSLDKDHQDTRVPGDKGDGKFNDKEFLALLGVEGHGEASSYDIKLKNTHEKAGGMFIGTEEWAFVETFVVRNEDMFPCCPNSPFVTLVGTITLRREPRYYLRYGVLPEIFMTLIGMIAHSFRGHTASSVTFICGTGFTVILTLTAHSESLVQCDS